MEKDNYGKPQPGMALKLTSFADLLANEPEIISRIAMLANGGALFLAHPFQCLADLGVELSPELRAELISDEPALAALSLPAYQAIKNETTPQPIQIRVRGLFKRRKQ